MVGVRALAGAGAARRLARARPRGVLQRRAERAARNLGESLPFFLAAAILGIVLDAQTPLALAGAAVFFGARVVYLLLYINGVPYIRSAVWTVGFIGILMMAWPLFGQLA